MCTFWEFAGLSLRGLLVTDLRNSQFKRHRCTFLLTTLLLKSQKQSFRSKLRDLWFTCFCLSCNPDDRQCPCHNIPVEFEATRYIWPVQVRTNLSVWPMLYRWRPCGYVSPFAPPVDNTNTRAHSEWTELTYHSSDIALPPRTLTGATHAREYAEDMQTL